MSEPLTPAQIEGMKEQAAYYAVDRFVKNGMVVGLGTGSTAAYAVREIARRLKARQLRQVVGIPTSRRTAQLALELGIPLGDLNSHPQVDVVLDGADEVDPQGNLIKGLGGALLWEKIVATAARQVVILVDERKRVDRLGQKAPLPVEVVPFGWRIHVPFLEERGAQVRIRAQDDGEPFVTDGGHYILDAAFPQGIPDPWRLAQALQARAGIVEHGLFLGMADVIVFGTLQGVEVMHVSR